MYVCMYLFFYSNQEVLPLKMIINGCVDSRTNQKIVGCTDDRTYSDLYTVADV